MNPATCSAFDPSRRMFLGTSAQLGGALMAGAIVAGAAIPAAAQTAPPATRPAKPPPLDRDAVNQFVRVAHTDLERTRSMLEQNPALVNSCWDWGGGDFETGLGGASHMGRADIALFLLGHGARIDLFAATMLGQIEIVRAVLTAFPDARHTLGPHKIPLIAHAEKGGPDAAEVLKYLRSLDKA
jgi:hypothetical protein